jgi:hypothetical protein
MKRYWIGVVNTRTGALRTVDIAGRSLICAVMSYQMHLRIANRRYERILLVGPQD